MKEEHRKLIESLEDEKAYAASHITRLGLERGTWEGRPDPKRAAKTFRDNLAKWTRIMGEPDGVEFVKGQGHLAVWAGHRWKTAAGLRD